MTETKNVCTSQCTEDEILDWTIKQISCGTYDNCEYLRSNRNSSEINRKTC